jgi:hypothetical protein
MSKRAELGERETDFGERALGACLDGACGVEQQQRECTAGRRSTATVGHTEGYGSLRMRVNRDREGQIVSRTGAGPSLVAQDNSRPGLGACT